MNPVMKAADILLRGGVIAYPTEGVVGVGCLPTINNRCNAWLRSNAATQPRGRTAGEAIDFAPVEPLWARSVGDQPGDGGAKGERPRRGARGGGESGRRASPSSSARSACPRPWP